MKNDLTNIRETLEQCNTIWKFAVLHRMKISFLYQEMRSTILVGLSDTTYSQALSHHCLVRVLLPAAFPPWASTFLIIESGTS